jgi:hypothetical protein
MKNARFELNSEQTLRLEELQKTLSKALQVDRIEEILPVAHFGCAYLCVGGCAGSCWGACGTNCQLTCRGGCLSSCGGSCWGTCRGSCWGDCQGGFIVG